MERRDCRKHRASIGPEPLEGRALPSTAGALIAPLKGSGGPAPSYVDLQGSARGVPSTVVGNPEVGTTVDFRGVGNVQGLGPVKVTGSLHGTGFLASSRVEGTIILANASGRLTLQLRGSKKGGFTAPGSGPYTFSVASGSGAFKRDFGDGTVDLVLGPRSFTLGFRGKPSVY